MPPTPSFKVFKVFQKHVRGSVMPKVVSTSTFPVKPLIYSAEIIPFLVEECGRTAKRLKFGLKFKSLLLHLKLKP